MAILKLILLVRSELRDQLLELRKVIVVIVVVETLTTRAWEHVLVLLNDVQLAPVVA